MDFDQEIGVALVTILTGFLHYCTQLFVNSHATVFTTGPEGLDLDD